MENATDKREFLATFFKSNFNSSSFDEFSGPVKDSSLKKTSALLKKLKQILPDQVETLLAEIKQVNLSMYLTEASSSFAENKPKNSAEIYAMIHVLLAFMVEYPDFRQSFVTSLLKSITADFETLDVNDKNSFTKFRWNLRLAMELHMLKVYNGSAKIKTITEKLFLQSEEKALILAPLACYLLKNFDCIMLPPITNNALSDFEGMGDIYEKYFKAMCRHVARLHKSFLGLQEHCKRFYESKGDLPAYMTSDLTNSLSAFREAETLLKNLAVTMNRSLPQLDEVKPKFEIIDGKAIFAGDLSFLASKSTQIFNDEDERLFYEEIPEYKRPEGVSNTFTPPPTPLPEAEFDEASIVEVDPEALEKAKASIPVEIERLCQEIDKLMTKDEADHLARLIVEKVSTNIYKYVDVLCSTIRRKNELIPLFCRMMAICAKAHPKMIEELIRSVIGQFTFLLHRKEPILGTRRRICRFIGELSKFHLMTQSRAYYCLKSCVKDFTGPNIDMFCMIVEYCGRFLYLQPESHARLAHLFRVVNNKRINTLDVSSDRQILITNALFMVDPLPFQFTGRGFDQCELYLNHLLSSELNETELCNALLECDWNDGAFISKLQDQFLQPWQFKSERSTVHTKCLTVLAGFYPEFVVQLHDKLLDLCLSFVEISSPLLPQQMLSLVYFVGRLYNYGTFDEKLIFSLLHHFICYDHSLNSPVPTSDGPEEHLRIKLVTSLLEPCRAYFEGVWLTEQLPSFLALFRCFVCSKVEISREIFEALTDLYQACKRPLLPLDLRVAVSEYSYFSTSRTFLDKLDYLNQDANMDPTYSGPISAELAAAQTTELLEDLDREMAKLVCTGLEQRKLERRPQNFEASVPLALKATSGENDGKLNIMMKKGSKKKAFLRQIG